MTGVVSSPNPLQSRVFDTPEAKNRQKSVFQAQKPKKTVENPRFSIDFRYLKAAL
jgi:hypothetical protein